MDNGPHPHASLGQPPSSMDVYAGPAPYVATALVLLGVGVWILKHAVSFSRESKRVQKAIEKKDGYTTVTVDAEAYGNAERIISQTIADLRTGKAALRL